MSTPPKKRGRPRSERPFRPFMLRLAPATIEALVRVAARDSSKYGGVRTFTAQDVARHAIDAYLRGDLPDGGPPKAAGSATTARKQSRQAAAGPEITRPLLKWPGGKWRLRKWIISHFPAHNAYVEPFGGAASVLIQKRPAECEVYNDLDGEIVNLVSVLKSEELAAELLRQLELTPYCRAEFNAAFGPAAPGPVEGARRTLIRAGMGHGSSGATKVKRTGFRSVAHGAWTSPASDWTKHGGELAKIAVRFREVEVESVEAIPLMLKHDGPGTLFYVDPPYLPQTRAKGALYAHEMTAEQHVELLHVLRGLNGMVILSGYRSDLYDGLLAGWVRREKAERADGGRHRTECLWLNPACAAKARAQR